MITSSVVEAWCAAAREGKLRSIGFLLQVDHPSHAPIEAPSRGPPPQPATPPANTAEFVVDARRPTALPATLGTKRRPTAPR